MNIQIPEPVQGYQLPDGSLVYSKEAYVAAMMQDAAERMAGAYIHLSGEAFGRGQATKTFNSIAKFLVWQAVQTYQGTLEGTLAQYDALRVEPAAEPAAEAAEVAEPVPAEQLAA